MPRYVVLLRGEPPSAGAEGARCPAWSAGRERFAEYVAARGRSLAAVSLAGDDVTTVVRRGPDDLLVVGDGPYVEVAEPVRGFHRVELPDLDAVIAATELLPGHCIAEIRPEIEAG